MTYQFPRWKYILLVLVAVLSFIYALPNWYGDEAALQISPTGGEALSERSIQTVKTTLQNAGIDFKSIKILNANLLQVSFLETESQLKAKEFVKASLGNNYTVALNIVPAAPHWLSALGANPMKLGLDLRGGVHLLLAVDVQSVIKSRITSTVTTMWEALQKKQIRYTGGAAQGQQGILLYFQDQKNQSQALDVLQQEFGSSFIFKTSNIGNRLAIVGTSRPEMISQMRQTVIDQTMQVLRKRVNELGVSEATIQQQGQDRIAVDLPGIQDSVQAKQILGGTATLEFHLVDEEHDITTALSGQGTLGSHVYHMEDGRPILLENRIILKGSAITSASTSFGTDGRAAVDIIATGPGVTYFNTVTAQNVGRRMGIVYLETKNTTRLDSKGQVVYEAEPVSRVINAAVIQSALGGHFQVTGLSDLREAKNLSMLLQAGALPTNIHPVAESVVGPSLGKDNIHKGVVSVEIGFLLIILFMVAYYRLCGAVANVGLALNLCMTVAIMSLIGATLTLPGIAALVLTVGMSVDANVLINERIREELRSGLSPLMAIETGYARAFVTIVDANVTTMIVAVVLYVFGTGSVKGFSVALIIGLLTSMFTAITGTRGLLSLIYRSDRRIERLSIGI